MAELIYMLNIRPGAFIGMRLMLVEQLEWGTVTGAICFHDSEREEISWESDSKDEHGEAVYAVSFRLLNEDFRLPSEPTNPFNPDSEIVYDPVPREWSIGDRYWRSGCYGTCKSTFEAEYFRRTGIVMHIPSRRLWRHGDRISIQVPGQYGNITVDVGVSDEQRDLSF